MEYCLPYNTNCIPLPPPATHTRNIRNERSELRLLDRMVWLFTPEPSDVPRHPAAIQPATWKESIKGLFWVAMSIGIGLLLAIVCS